MATSKFYFMLPSLVRDGLLDDDSLEYALTSYPRTIASQSAQIVVADFSTRPNSIDFSTKKRIKFFIEYCAVALSLPIQNCPLMNFTRKSYRKWFENPDIFGDNKRQNKYVRRLIKNLSLPFTFNSPESPEMFKGEFNTLLNNILDDLKYFHTTHGRDFERETWKTVFYVSCAITDAILNFDFATKSWLPPLAVAKLVSKSFETCFTSIVFSGLKDEDMWSNFVRFCHKWSCRAEFFKAWRVHVDQLFTLLHGRLFEIQVQEFMSEGSYSQSSPAPTEMVTFVFQQFVSSIDEKAACSAPEAFDEFTKAIARLVDSAIVFADSVSTIFKKKYPGYEFLKLFGRYLTCSSDTPEAYDAYFATYVDSLISIISNFDFGKSPEPLRLLAHVTSKIDTVHMHLLASFLNKGSSLFRRDQSFLPYIADLALTLIPQLVPGKAPKVVGNKFYCLTSGLLTSAASFVQDAERVKAAINSIWKCTTVPVVKYQLLSLQAFTNQTDTDIFTNLQAIFEKGNFRVLITDANGSLLVCANITLVGLLTSIRPSLAQQFDQTVGSSLFCLILNDAMSFDHRSMEGIFEQFIFAIFVFLENLLEFAPNVYSKPENIKVFFEFIAFIRKSLSSAPWAINLLRLLKSLLDDIMLKVLINCPQRTQYSRYYGDLVNEAIILRSFDMKEEDVNVSYFTVNDKMVISFIEAKTGEDPLIVLIRGNFGTFIWKVRDDILGSFPAPKLSDEFFVPEELLQPHSDLQDQERSAAQSLIEQNLRNYPVASNEELENVDEAIRKAGGSHYSEIVDWAEHSFLPELGKKSPYLRKRVVDFVTQLSIINGNNSKNVKIIKNSEKLQETLNRYDVNEVPKLIYLPIIHVLTQDENLKWNPSHFNRMSRSLNSFLKEIAEPLVINENICDELEFPRLRTSVPALSLLRAFALILTPSMAKDEDGAKKIFNLASPIKIYYNETNFDLRLVDYGKDHVIVIHPTAPGLYHVTEVNGPEGFISPFAEESTMTALQFGFNLQLCLEANPKSQGKILDGLVQQRLDILQPVFSKPTDISAASLVGPSFDN